MIQSAIIQRLPAAFVALAAGASASAGQLSVVSVEPAAHILDAAISTPIVVHFDQPVSRASVTAASFRAFGRWSGTV